ncbi:Fungal trans [Geosmithia morbida]|uniref:Fungal trans n=1 Tax=Geosmithia morbida TaxID=1094350 RepID=A0A9P4YNV8_9HYPO|nr:Fungal trans [Geosmithia morbida]KAF4119335.1 Fungal trans [Geosmithia morbida]
MADDDQPLEAGEHVSFEQLTPEEANRIIHSHRKVRYGTACWPCRQRKVKCDNKHPCENCVKREHAQLCSYKPNRGSNAAGNSSSSTVDRTVRKRARSFSDTRDANNKLGKRESWPRSIGTAHHRRTLGTLLETDANPDNLEEGDAAADRYLGQNSIPALLGDQSPTSRMDRVDIRQDVRSILGLDTSAPFPLMSRDHLNSLAQDIASELPSDRDVMKLFRTYKEIPQPFWGFVIDIDDFELKLLLYLENRSRNAKAKEKSSGQVTASWLAILFGVLAVGSQYHESPYHVRTRDSQKYMQISFHFLRLGNFLLRPSFDSIQALLLTNFVLLNDMKAEASWALTGLTCRLAQSLGLHRPNPYEGREQTPDMKSTDMIRRKLWWTCVWHDTLTSLSFDRAPMTNFPSCSIPVQSDGSEKSLSYLETMYHLIGIISRRLNPDTMAAATYAQILEHCEAVEVLRTKARVHMQDKDKCKTALERLQYFAIQLHTSFVISVACRPALRRDRFFDPVQRRTLAKRCKANLSETVRMFLAMHQLSVIPTRTWAFTYHGLSSALLLGILCETKTDPEVRQLQGDLIAALSATAAKEASPGPDVATTDKDIELSGPLHRALTALKNIYDHGSINGSNLKREGDSSTGGSGTITPKIPFGSTTMAATMVAQAGAGQQQQQQQQLRGLPSAATAADPRENAALAMAEMQNGSSLQDPNGSASAELAMPPPDMINDDDLSQMDPTQYMAPMDLYDTIWGSEYNPESLDPWNTGVDAMNFDFLAQPPPGQPQQQFYF